jgi:hypothetical protein
MAVACAAAVAAIVIGAQPALGKERAPLFRLAGARTGATIHAWPGGPVQEHLAGRSPLGSPTWLWVIGHPRADGWGRVVLPLRPNGTTGWIRLRDFRVIRSRIWVLGNLTSRQVVVLRGRHEIARFPAAIGAPGTPTPTGSFSVTDRVDTGDPGGPFGWYAFGLSGYQPNLPAGWGGGDQLAIHGTNAPNSIGQAASAGCLRVSPSALSRLRGLVRLGTPVVIARRGGQAWKTAIRTSASAPPPSEPRPALADAADAPVWVATPDDPVPLPAETTDAPVVVDLAAATLP